MSRTRCGPPSMTNRLHCRLPIVTIVTGAFFAAIAPARTHPSVNRPKLVVLVVFDQLRGDYPSRWQDCFGMDGFKRIEREGTWFTNCHYPYAGTQTGPGHASLATGCSPNRHGIVANDWFERSAGETVHCTTHTRFDKVYSVPPPPELKKTVHDDGTEELTEEKSTPGCGCPDRLLAPTIGDSIKIGTGGIGRVVSLSMKERSAVLLGGHKADACYWFDTRTGSFCTSTRYRDRPAAWVNAFNAAKHANKWFTTNWIPARSDLDYRALSGPDDVQAEGTGIAKKQGRIFPHPMSGGLTEPGKQFYETVYTSPFGNELLLEFAMNAIEAEKLGHDDTPDYLAISFPCNDPIGHVYGPDSQEVLDVTIRTDRLVADLLKRLDASIGAGKYVLALSSDHGVCPLPEVSARKGIEARRLDPKAIRNGALKHLNATFGITDEKAAWFEKELFPWTYLNRKFMASKQLSEDSVANALADWYRKQPWALAAYTRQQLIGELPANDVFGRMMQKSFRPERSGDVAMVTKPYYLVDSAKTGTGHNSPHFHDTHVPLMVFGANFTYGISNEPVTPQAAAVILTHAAAVPAPGMADTPLPTSLKQP